MNTKTNTSHRVAAVPVVAADAPTIVHLFRNRSTSRADAPALRWHVPGRWAHLTWGGYGRAVAEVATGLRTFGSSPATGWRLLRETAPSGTSRTSASSSAGLVSVPIYATSSASQVAYVLEHSEARICFVENVEQLAKVELHRDQLRRVEHVVVIDDSSSIVDPSVGPMSEVSLRGSAQLADDPGLCDRLVDAVEPSDLATLVYTSGTTGPPKGAMITHANVMATMRSLTSLIELRSDDRYLSFLPLSHITERCVSHFGQIASGGETWFAQSLATVAEDLQDCRPTVFFAVPRVWEKFRDGVTRARRGRSTGSRALADALPGRRRPQPPRASRRTGSWPRASACCSTRSVGRKIRRQLGLDRARLVTCGAAPVHPDLLRWFHAIGLPIAEGYGQTEVSLCTSLNPPAAIRIGTVGKPIPGVSVQIADDGEILVRGDNVCAGYWRDERASKALIDRAGWLHTGDLGRFEEDGYLTVTGRKKDLIITAYGKNIQPEGLETRLRERAAHLARRRHRRRPPVPDRAPDDRHRSSRRMGFSRRSLARSCGPRG